MSPKSQFLILSLIIIISIFPICLSTYSFSEHDSNPWTYITSHIHNDNNDQGSSNELYTQDLVHNNRFKYSHHRGSRIINVEHFIKSANNSDDTKAFENAWKEVCSTKGGVFLVLRNKKYMVGPVNFTGPCHSHLRVKIEGIIEASTNISAYDRYHWLVFQNLSNFKVEGGGTVDGRGKIWWQNSCKFNKSKPCLHAPTAVMFLGCKNFIVEGLKIRNPQQMHMSIQYSSNIRVSNVNLEAPGNSPNTDGININATRSIQIRRSSISTGDDCVSIVNGSEDVEVSHITCGPGHGISIGSLGKNHSVEDHVSNVLINKARLSGTTNGMRIKTWQGGRGSAKNIVFRNIAMHNVSNPIIIDQYYCDQKTPCPEQKSAVHVSDVVYKNIKGTSFTEPAIKFNCSKIYHCRDIVLDNVDLVMEQGKGVATADCQNVELSYREKVSPRCSQAT